MRSFLSSFFFSEEKSHQGKNACSCPSNFPKQKFNSISGDTNSVAPIGDCDYDHEDGDAIVGSGQHGDAAEKTNAVECIGEEVPSCSSAKAFDNGQTQRLERK